MPGGRPKGSKNKVPRAAASRKVYAELVGPNADRAEWSPMAVMLYAVRRSFTKARSLEQAALKRQAELQEAQSGGSTEDEIAALAGTVQEADEDATKWFNDAVSKAVLVAPYVHPKLVAQPQEPPKIGNPNSLSDAELAEIAQAQAENAAGDLDGAHEPIADVLPFVRPEG